VYLLAFQVLLPLSLKLSPQTTERLWWLISDALGLVGRAWVSGKIQSSMGSIETFFVEVPSAYGGTSTTRRDFRTV
jgi:hypothetical protein